MSAAGSLACRYKTQTTGEIALQFLPSKAAVKKSAAPAQKSVDQGIPTRMPRHKKCLQALFVKKEYLYVIFAIANICFLQYTIGAI